MLAVRKSNYPSKRLPHFNKRKACMGVKLRAQLGGVKIRATSVPKEGRKPGKGRIRRRIRRGVLAQSVPQHREVKNAPKRDTVRRRSS